MSTRRVSWLNCANSIYDIRENWHLTWCHSIVKVFLGRTSAENGVLKHIMEIKFARRKPLL